MENVKGDKICRVLQIYTKLADGYIINKTEEAQNYGVNERSIQRDIDDIRDFLDIDSKRTGILNTIVYDRQSKGYRLETLYKIRLMNSEVLALCKILLDSRAFTKKEIFHYVEPRHKTKFIDRMWDIGQAIRESKYIEIDYQRTKDKAIVHRKMQPVAIMFSEYYFYVTAFIADIEVREDFDVINDSFPTIYRVDRIKSLHVLDEKFYIPYNNRFEEGEFRKRIQFMYGGTLQKTKFVYSGYDVDSVLDRLPTAQIMSEQDGKYTICAETFGTGIEMWLRSQGDNVKILDD